MLIQILHLHEMKNYGDQYGAATNNQQLERLISLRYFSNEDSFFPPLELEVLYDGGDIQVLGEAQPTPGKL